MKKLLKNKRGDDHEGFLSTNKFFFYMVWVIFIGFVISAFVILVVRGMDSKTEIHNSIDADFSLARATNVCFAYEDPQTKNIRQNIIDFNKFNDQNLESCFKSEYPQSFEIILKPVNEEDFIRKSIKMGNPYTSDIAYARYTLVALNDEEIKPGMIYFIP